MTLGLGASFGVAGQPLVDLGQATLEHLAPFGDLRGVQVELTATTGHGGGLLLELDARRGTQLVADPFVVRGALELGETHLELGEPLRVGVVVRAQGLDLGDRRVGLGAALVALGLHPLQRAAGRVERGRGPAGGVGCLGVVPAAFGERRRGPR